MAVKKIVGLIVLLLGVIIGTMAVRAYWWEVFKVPTESMVPTFAVGDLLLVNKMAFKQPWSSESQTPKSGDVVVFYHPQTHILYVKRAIGLPGDEVMILGGTIWINGVELETSTSTGNLEWGGSWNATQVEQKQLSNGATYRTVSSADKMLGWKMSGYWTVPPNHVFVVGDWRDHSSDSREWGSVPLDAIVGRVACSWGEKSKGCDFN